MIAKLTTYKNKKIQEEWIDIVLIEKYELVLFKKLGKVIEK